MTAKEILDACVRVPHTIPMSGRYEPCRECADRAVEAAVMAERTACAEAVGSLLAAESPKSNERTVRLAVNAILARGGK